VTRERKKKEENELIILKLIPESNYMGFPKLKKIPMGQPNRTTKYNCFPKLIKFE